MIVVAAGNDPVDLAEHVVEVLDGLAIEPFREALGARRFDVPAMGDLHPGKGEFSTFRPRVDQRSPSGGQVRVGADVETAYSKNGIRIILLFGLPGDGCRRCDSRSQSRRFNQKTAAIDLAGRFHPEAPLGRLRKGLCVVTSLGVFSWDSQIAGL